MPDVWDEQIRARVHEAFGGEIVYREVAKRIGMNPETVRRQLGFGKPSVPLLIALANEYGLDMHWLLTGHGTPFRSDLLDYALDQYGERAILRSVAAHFARTREKQAPAREKHATRGSTQKRAASKRSASPRDAR